MPLYTFEHPITGEIQDLVFGINDEKIFIDIQGVKWNRVFSAPNVSIDSNIDPFSKKDFINKTSKGGTYGELMDRSKELSDKRKQKLGYDPVQKDYFKKYSEKRSGNKHYLDS
jgi:hypothetical protein